MAKSRYWACLTAIIILEVMITITITPAAAVTVPSDVEALQELYKNLNYPSQLLGWKSIGGDPCGELWTGVLCDAASVINIIIPGLGLKGYLGRQLNLPNLKELVLSFNEIQGQIPDLLLPDIAYVDLSSNKFRSDIPHSLAFLKHLRHLNLSHNTLSGTIGNYFSDMQSLKQMDLSYNSFSGDLPSSFGNLTSLTGLFLQNNQFTGSVNSLANLPLTDLNIQNNNFSGVLAKQFQRVPNLWIWGNQFQNGADSPPWDFPLDTILRDQNISSPPATELSAIENYPSLHVGKQRERRFSPVGIACGIVGVALVASCTAIIIAIHIKRSRVHDSQDLKGDRTVLPISTKYDNGSAPPDELPQSLPHKSPHVLVLKSLPSSHHGTAGDLSKINCFSRGYRHSLTAKSYSVDELQLATGNFKEENLLGEGSLGSVFKAQFPDGQTLVVKNINTAALSIHEEEQFLYAVSNVSRLKHPNIVALAGYCIEHGRYFLVYEYVRNLSLEDALHHAVHKHLSWIMRIRIAVAIARALEYMHSACVPPVAHCNLKSANILLDNELMPHLCDCGLAALKPLTKNSINLKVPGLGMNFLGYSAPENRQTEKEEVKSDIYAFGVLLLELLTGRKPFDCSRPGKEQSLVKWASSRLHDYNSLEEMVDPTTLGRYLSRSLSRFADIISLCIQTEPEFRPAMSEIVESLELLNERSSSVCFERDAFELSLQPTVTSSALLLATSTSNHSNTLYDE